MSRVRITNSGEVGEGLACYGTVVELDGKEVHQVREIRIAPITIDGTMQVELDVIASESFEAEFGADVTVRNIHVSECPSCSVQRRGPMRSWISLYTFTEVWDVSHMQSPGRYRQRTPGDRRAALVIRMPVVLVDLWHRIRATVHRKVAA